MGTEVITAYCVGFNIGEPLMRWERREGRRRDLAGDVSTVVLAH